MSTNRRSGRGSAYVGALLGGSLSITANIAHSFVASRPGVLAVTFSAAWPLLLLVGVEILVRVPWPAGRGWAVVRFGGLLPIAMIAGLVSYEHMSGLLAHYGESPLVSALGPVAIDGLMIMATGALLATNRHRVAVTEPVPVTVRDVLASPVVPPVSEPVTVTAESAGEISGPGGTRPQVAVPDAPTAPVETVKRPARKPAKRVRAKSLTSVEKVSGALAKIPTGSAAQVAALAGVSESTARRHLRALKGASVASSTDDLPAETLTLATA